METNPKMLKTRGGDDRVCQSHTSFFNNNHYIIPSSARGGDDRVCQRSTSFFERNKESVNVHVNNDIEKEIFEARSNIF